MSETVSMSKATEDRKILFERNNVLGSGRFGTVYADVLNSVKVAVKRVPIDHVDKEEFDDDEEEALSRMKNPNVVKLLGVEENFSYK